MFERVTNYGLILAVSVLAFGIARAQVPEGYNTPIPESIMTPDEVDTRVGKLRFFDGIPTQETADKVMENLLFLRGVETFLNGIPAASVESIRGRRIHNPIPFFELQNFTGSFGKLFPL